MPRKKMSEENATRRWVRIPKPMTAWLDWWCATEGISFQEATMQALQAYYEARKDTYAHGPTVPDDVD